MRKGLLMFLAGIAVAVTGAAAWQLSRTGQRRTGQPAPRITDLNAASRDELQALGLDIDSVERVLENRPYRNKLDLVSRMILPEDLYASIRHRVGVDNADEPVMVA